ncbi:MAG: glycoside hydrolase family 3 C-terminal domain-containing protein [Planctomycetota bacterium]
MSDPVRPVKQLTLAERVRLLSGADAKRTIAVPRLGIPPITLVDGPHCARRVAGALDAVPGASSTCFPTGTGLAASWDVDLLRRVGQALGRETIGVGAQVLLGPTVNIIRHPLAGRGFECLSEDPQLSAALAVAYIAGLQAQGVGACIKHYACNNQETERYRIDVRVSERVLRELYLPAFEAAVREAGAWSLMAAYNRVNGQFCCQHQDLLRRILIEEWGFDGVVVSDWGAVHASEASIDAGCHLEMPGPGLFYNRHLADAVEHGQVAAERIDDAAERVLRLNERCQGERAPAEVDSAGHRQLALEAAEAGMVLLKNEADCLPLPADRLRRLAVIGPNAAETHHSGGGSSCGTPPYRISVLEGLRLELGDAVAIAHERGCDHDDVFLPPIPAEWFPDGLRRQCWSSAWPEADAAAEQTQHSAWINDWFMRAADGSDACVTWQGEMVVPADGDYRFVLDHSGAVALQLDDQVLIEDRIPGPPIASERALPTANCRLEAGRRYRLRLCYRDLHAQMFTHCKLMAARESTAEERNAAIRAAVTAAAQADAAVLVVGDMDNVGESEGVDRRSLALSDAQNALIQAVAQANPRTVVVINRGGPSLMPWIEQVPAVLQSWLAGQEVGRAVARILLGFSEAGGRLPMSFPRRVEDIGASYPGASTLAYDEGLLVGYRWHDAKQLPPLFPFGHGLGYAGIELMDATVPGRVTAGSDLVVEASLVNRSGRAGSTVLQCYASWPRPATGDPVRELVGFHKVRLAPGEERRVRVTVPARALRRWGGDGWCTPKGEYRLDLGFSAADLQLHRLFRCED